MAELAIKVGSNLGTQAYKDGDILCAFNSRRIRCTHAQHICDYRKIGRNGGGLIVSSSVAKDFFDHTHQYKFQRISKTEIKRITLSDMSEEALSDKPNVKGEQIAVEEFIRRRKMRSDHYLFGNIGSEFWYGGRKDFSNAKMDLVWNAIETKTPLRESNHTLWPTGAQDLKVHLFLSVDDFDDSETENLVESEIDETDLDNPIIVKKRKRYVIWQDLFPLNVPPIITEAHVTDKVRTVDVRPKPQSRTAIVKVKD